MFSKIIDMKQLKTKHKFFNSLKNFENNYLRNHEYQTALKLTSIYALHILSITESISFKNKINFVILICMFCNNSMINFFLNFFNII